MRSNKSFIKTPPGILLASFLAVAVLVGCFFLAKIVGAPIYHRWNQDKLLAQARELYEAEDYSNAMITVRKIVQRYDDNKEAWELGLKIAEAENSTDAITFSYMLEQRDPTLENKLGTIGQALKFGSFSMARDLLAKLPREAASDTRTHKYAIEVYKAYQDTTNLKAHLRSLISLEPENMDARFELALLQLASTNAKGETVKIADLEGLADSEKERDAALRAILAYAERAGEAELAKRYLEKAKSMPDLSDSTKIQMASAAKAHAPESFDPMVNGLLAKEQPGAPYATAVINFLNRSAQPARAIQWHESLPPETKDAVAVREALVLSYLLQERWDQALGKLLESDWENYEFKRLLLLSFAYDRRGNVSARDQAFMQGLGAAADNARQIEEMRQKAALWSWRDLEAESYRKLFRLNPLDEEAARKIVSYDKTRGDTEQLLLTFATLIEANPKDLDAKNNFAYLNLLKRSNLKQALSLAEECVKKAPNKVPYKITYALALLRNDRPADALAAIESLRPIDFGEGESNLTRAVVLAANGRHGEAQSLTRLINSVGFLPEEERMVTELKSMIARAGSQIDDAERLRQLRRRLAPEQEAIALFPESIETPKRESYEMARVLFQLGMYAEAEVALMDSEWEGQEHLRHAAMAQLQRARGQTRSANDSWSDAVLFASNQTLRLAELRDCAALWDWDEKRIAVARLLFDKDPRDRAAFEQLVAAYEEDKALSDLLNVYESHLRVDASDDVAKAQLAYIYLISRQDPIRGHLLSREADRASASIESEKAAMASLLLQESWAEVLSRFAQLSTLDQMKPEIRLMQSLALFKIGDEAKARLEFSGIDASKLKFFELSFFDSVKATLSAI